MIKIKAKLELYKVRKTAFGNGYRPLFNFVSQMKTSGQIRLLDRDEFPPGDEALVEITFLNKDYLGDDLSVGNKFTFDEGSESLGHVEIVEILET